MDDLENLLVTRLRKEITAFAHFKVPNDTPHQKGTGLIRWKIERWAEEQELACMRNVPLSEMNRTAIRSLANDGAVDMVLADWVAICVDGRNSRASLAALEEATERGYVAIWIRWGDAHSLPVPPPVHLICLTSFEQTLGALIEERKASRQHRPSNAQR